MYASLCVKVCILVGIPVCPCAGAGVCACVLCCCIYKRVPVLMDERAGTLCVCVCETRNTGDCLYCSVPHPSCVYLDMRTNYWVGPYPEPSGRGGW